MNQECLPQLASLKQRDVETRKKLLSEGRLYGAYAEEIKRCARKAPIGPSASGGDKSKNLSHSLAERFEVTRCLVEKARLE